MTDMPPVARPSSGARSLAFIGLGVVALVVVTSVVVLVAGGGAADEPLPDGSPQRALQEYLAAYEAGDYGTALTFFSSEVQATTTSRSYRDLAASYGEPFGDGTSRRVLFDQVVGTGDRVRLLLTVEEFYQGGLLGGGTTYRSPREVPMVRQDGVWRIDELLVWLDPAPIKR